MLRRLVPGRGGAGISVLGGGTATRRKRLVNTAGARAVGEHRHRYQADLEEREVREEQEEQEVQEEQDEQGELEVQVALEALLAHGYTTRRR
ncbi:unnamed protein product [Closterium sp. NIES-54]